MFDQRRTTAVETAKVTCPVLVVSGSDDKVVSAVTARRIAELYPRASFHEAAGRGHLLIWRRAPRPSPGAAPTGWKRPARALRTTL